MNKFYSSQQVGKFSRAGEIMLAILLVAAFFQIALCFSASCGLVPSAAKASSTDTQALLTTNTPSTLGDSPSVSKISTGFPSTPARG
jgi:hypothetical protein